MKKKDIERLFDLLSIYFPGHPSLRDNVLRSAWLLVLKPFEPDDVKRAVAAYLRDCQHFPHPQEIAVKCHAPAAAPATEDVYMCQQDKCHLAHVQAYQSALRAALQERDLPPMPVSGGLAEWHRAVEAAGVDIVAIIGDTWRAVSEQKGV